MSGAEFSLETTVRDLEDVTAEITRLRDAVAEHREAALGLNEIATSLGELARQLPLLPGEIQSQFSGIPALVSSLETALRPTGTLELAINDVVATNKQLVQQLQVDREAMHARLSADRAALEAQLNTVHEDTSALRELVVQLHGETMSKLAGLSERHGEHSAAQAESAELIKARLAKLTGLARRGFLAILRGKDAPPAPF